LGKKRRKIDSKVDITSFLVQSSEKRMHEEPKVSEVKVTTEVPAVDIQVEAELMSFIRTKGKVRKSKVYQWSKERRITPASLYRALVNLERKGLIKKEFDEDVKELIYIVTEI